MKRITPLAVLPIGTLALVGCGSDNADEERIDELEAQVEELESGSGEVEASDYEGDPILEGAESRMDGKVDALLGEPVTVDLGPYEDTNPYAGEVALESVEFSDTCIADARDGSTETSSAGQFATLTFTIEADSAAEEAIEVNSNTFQWDDYDYALSTPDSLECELDLGDQEPVEPGESGQYVAIWDVPTTSASLRWTDPSYTVTWHIDGTVGESPEGGDDTPAEQPAETPAAQEPSEPAVPAEDEMHEWESDGGYVSHYEYDDAMTEGECPVGERNLDANGLDCQPLSMSFERYAEENGITFDEPEADDPEYEDPESCTVLLYNVQTAGKRLEQTEEGSAEHDAVLDEFLAARDEAEAAGC